ncbi:MAG: OmpA family protein [Flavobacteriales bacterium]|nr:OmpA family protein [Flavobacteriales bacterium]
MNTIKNILSFTLFLFLMSCATAQPQREYSSSNKKAIKAYEAALTAYNTFDPRTGMPDLKGAESNLTKSIKSDPNFIEAYLLMSQVYQDWGKSKEAIDYLKKSIEINPNFFPNSFFFLARLEFNEGNYADAKVHAEKYLSFPRVPEDMKRAGQKIVSNSEFAMKLIANPVPFTPVNLGPGVNTDRPEYFPTITADDNTLLFTRLVVDPNAQQGGVQEDFFVSQKRGGQWSTARSISSRINTLYNEGAPSLASDGQTLIFTACEIFDSYGDYRDGFGSCDLFVTRRIGNEWTVPVNLGETINSANWESQPSFSADGKTLYFIRGTRSKDGRRTGDIWYATLNKSGEWNRPQRLSDVVNTDGNEASVLIHPDGQTLYFSSDGHPGMGNLDIFVSRKQPDGSWGKPENLGYPINTHAEENSLLVSSDGKVAFFASDRPGGFGDLDLYSFELPANVRPQFTTYFKGIVYDAKTKKPLEAKFELIDLRTGEVVVTSYSNEANGEFMVALATNRDYALNVNKRGYNFYSKNFNLTERKGESDPFLMDVPLVPLEMQEVVRLDNVFFDLDKSTLRPESKIELDKLYAFLMNNPKIKIQLNGHTDNRGDKAHNQKLSEDRAKAVVDYLIAKGIEPGRLSSKGFGDTKPIIADPKTEADHQMNRRTEYIILQ